MTTFAIPDFRSTPGNGTEFIFIKMTVLTIRCQKVTILLILLILLFFVKK